MIITRNGKYHTHYKTNLKIIKFTDEEDGTALTQYHKRTTGKIYGEFDYTSESDLAEGEKTIGKYFAPTPLKGIDGAPMSILPVLAEKNDSTQAFKRRLNLNLDYYSIMVDLMPMV